MAPPPFIISYMEYLIVAIQFILSLSILVTLHEFGHFLPARWFGMRVEKFYLFFDPWFALFKTQRGETEWGVGWLPLGGYVKIAGMIDESMDTEQLNQPPQEWEFRSKPAWQRLVVMLGGVTVNFILGFFIFGMLLWVYGEKKLPADNVRYGVAVMELGQEMGLKTGDKILKVGNKELDYFTSGVVLQEIVINMAKSLEVEREGARIELNIPDSTAGKLASNKAGFMEIRVPMVAGDFSKESTAKTAGMEKGDSIIACNGMEVHFFDEFVREVQRQKDQELSITVIRSGKDKPLVLKVTPNEDGKVGVAPFGPDRYMEFETIKHGPLTAFPLGVQKGWNFLYSNIKAMGQMVTGSGHVKATESLGGFISIAKLFPTEWQWERFWYMTAVLSLILGFMNLLPIPALDGGHAVFLLIEIIMRRPVPQQVMEKAQVVGFILLISLLLFANGMDFIRWFKG